MPQSTEDALNSRMQQSTNPSDHTRWAEIYDFTGQTIVITGGTGVLGGAIACGCAAAGANVAVVGRNADAGEKVRNRMGATAKNSEVFCCDVVDPDAVRAAASAIKGRFGGVDVLINAAGGNNPKATTGDQQRFFDLPSEALRWVFELNVLGTILPSQVFGKIMAEQGRGCILNISSMAADRPLTRAAAYSSAKAAVSNFTQWLAVHLAQEYSPNIRVNAIAPGFFQTEQNRFLLTDRETGALTPRGKSIIAHTPMGRFGDPQDLLGAVMWLLSPAASFVTGAVIPVDGGFSAFSGV
jgi:NAD(P)-dependent dehydrogenase (short-subunit alcohol dehydrogenase family)